MNANGDRQPRAGGVFVQVSGVLKRVAVKLSISNYEKAAEIAREAFGDNRSIVDLVVEKGYLTRAQVDEALRPENMLQPIRSSHESRE